MYKTPTVEEVTAIAAKLGISLGPEEAALWQKLLTPQLERFNDFVQSRDYAEAKPEVTYAQRSPGYRPSTAEDPLGAWAWKCEIEGTSEGVLAGKTVSYKDHTAVAGIPMSFGTYAFEDYIPDFDATIVTRTLAAGGKIVGKNTMNGFVGGYGMGGNIGDYARPLNPHDHSKAPGGSSSGSAVAVVRKEVDISYGGDQGGSIRVPASWSGLLGLKCTFGLISHWGLSFGADMGIDFTGPMTLTSEDGARALQAVAGYDPLDPRMSRECPDSVDVLSTLSDGVKGLKIGILEEGFNGAEPDVVDLVDASIDVLVEAGAVASKVSIPVHDYVPIPASAIMAEGSRAMVATGIFGSWAKSYYPQSLVAAANKYWDNEIDLMSPRYKANFVLAELLRKNFHGRVYSKAQNIRPTINKAYDDALAEVDVLVMPTTLRKAYDIDGPEEYLEKVEADITLLGTGMAKNTMPFDYTGHPALAVPVGKSGGLPVSLQLVGKHFSDALLYQVAYAYEHSVDWDAVVGVGR